MVQKETKAKTALLSLKNLLTNKKSNYAGHKAFREKRAIREIKATLGLTGHRGPEENKASRVFKEPKVIKATLVPQVPKDYKDLLERLAPKVHRAHKAFKVKLVHRGQRVIKAIRETQARPAILQ